MTTSALIDVPDAFVASYGAHGAAERAWLAELPALGAAFLDRWALRPDGPARYGMASLVLPVRRADATPAALKLQRPREETAGATPGLRAWRGNGIVRLLDHDEASATQLLERLDAGRPLSAVPDDTEALRILAELMARLVAVPAPAGLRQLADLAAAMLDQTPQAVRTLHDPAERRLVRTCASAVAGLLGESGNRLLHWDLHYDNVLAAEREPWLAIDPEPLAGDPSFELLPALVNRWDDVAATGDVRRAVLRRFDLLTEVVGLDRERAAGWTLGRVLQNALWDVEDGESALEPDQVAIATALLEHRM
ncbi:aminoglycoside phosphotransferase family protein [Streptomyces noursei]|uniref:aminoglycoside phosphotransferase family protein n=1 Tax=Streptomyces noursei TaxID=1971 RepID=UPI00167B03B3|nr:aminoglycoside phosphotransferase family protein [Streptomyces noursei]MCZ1019581.1 hydroxyurea phosphotransferase [Streptomyces noursei]GGX09666.1 hydroxyurea phosphotransferase [Streptomyces noursei]